jgi:6-pyruvoyltetrahydropterin/6-carboxytetrahydropterin synthase
VAKRSHGLRPGTYASDVTHRIRIARAEHKFSCAHMTVFPDGSKERLHGHNYTIALTLEVARVDLAAMVPFSPIKAVLGELCGTWKEHVLLATENQHFALIRDDSELEFTLCGERYVLPRRDALLLPIDNVSVEALAAYVATVMRDRVAAIAGPDALAFEVTIEESPGQGSSCTLALR